ncbi:MAG: SusD/RagB family nutrient-binding outer membrane lipoprotein [Gemmatimonadales bacterium]|jgi:hypothetical protein
MKRIHVARAALVVGLIWAVSACDSLTDINTNPNSPTDVGPGLLLPNAIRNGIEGGAYSNWQAYSHTGPWAYHVVEIQYPDEERGNVRPGNMDGFWDGYYTGPLMDIQTVINKGVESEDENVQAVGMIWKAWLFHVVTDYWGDVPYSEALGVTDPESGALNTTPAYDSQEDIYAAMLDDLTTAATMLENPGTTDFADGDLLYDNDFESWRRFANSLRMRLAMRLSEVDATTAQTEFAAAYAAGGFESNADNALLRYPGSPYENPWYENYLGRDDHGISGFLVDTLIALNDPRLFYYAEPAENSGLYVGHYNGYQSIPGGTSLDDWSRIGNFWRADGAATPNIIMSYAEVLFLEAEAANRGWIAADAGTLYEDGIRASMNQYDEFGVGPSDTDIDDYLAQAGVAYDGTLAQIQTQKWIALFMNGPEAWFDNRRTDVPVLPPGPDLELIRIPVRMEYPSGEQSYNLDNLNAALQAQGMASGVDLVTPVWWDVNAP